MPTAQSVMLAIHCKKTETVDLKAPLISYIRNTYSDKEADEAADDLEKVQRLRADVALMQSGAQPNSRETLVKYLRCLTAIETRFPISKDKGHAAVSFTWIDAFRPARKNSQYNIHYEKACVMFNLAALLSQQGLSSDRSSADGLTQACKLFQEAAGVFQYMREIEAPKADSPRPQDIATEVVVLLEKLMLTQAQECVYHKAVIDKKSPGVLSRLAKQTCVMYEEVDRQFSGAALATYFDKSWGQHASLKASIYQVEELIQAAKQYTSEDKVNFTIAILKEAFARLQNTRKIAKGINNDMLESVNKTQELVQNLLNRAEKDNSTIYLMKVPTFSEVPPTTGALLVKVVPPVGLNDASGEQLFTGLIPDSCAKAISKYTEMVDSLIRTQLDKLAGATDNARLRLREWELPDTLDALDARAPGAALPEALARDLEEISSIGGVVHLKGILAEIGELRRDVEEDLRGSQAALEADASADTEARTQFGDKWRTTPAATAAKPYWDRIMQYRSSLQKAGESDGGVIKRLDANEAAFADLNVEAAAMRMPRLQAPMVSTSPDDPLVVVARLRAGLEGLQSLASARAGMEEKLKEVKNTDNVLPKVMGTPPQQHEALFTQEIKKYDALCGDVAKNITAQDELLANVGRDNVTFRSVYDLNGWRAQCEAAAAGMKETVKAYRELLDHCSEGLRFYIGMAEVVKKARQECEDYAFTRQVQRDELKQDLSRRTREEESERLAQRLAQANIGARPPGSAPAAAPAYPNLPHGHQPGQSQAPPPPPPPPMQTAHAAAGAPPPPPPPPEYHAPQQQHAPPPPPPQAPAAPQPHSAAPPPPPPQQQPGVQAQPPPQYYGGYGQPAGYAAPPGGYPGYAYAAPPAYGYAPPPPPPGAPQYAPPPPPPYYGAPQQPYYGYQHQQQ